MHVMAMPKPISFYLEIIGDLHCKIRMYEDELDRLEKELEQAKAASENEAKSQSQPEG